jgi:hypothetical protein
VILGIYYYAVDQASKQYFSAPDGFAIRSPGIYHPENPFPGMVVMMNVGGYHFDIWNDTSQDVPPEDDYEDVTDKVYAEYRSIWLEDKE